MSQDLTEIDQTTFVSAAASERLYKAGVATVIAMLAWCYWSTGGDVHLAQWVSLGIIVLASLPALRWAKTRRTWFPAFEISMLACIAFYAFPLFQGNETLAAYDDAEKVEAALLVLIYAACANIGFTFTRGRPRPPAWAADTLLPASAINWVPAGMALNVGYSYVSIYLRVLPPSLEGSLRALFFGVGIMSVFILARMWGLGKLKRQQIGFFVVCMAAYLILSFSSLYLIGGISMLVLAFISYASARRRVPWILLAACLAVVALLHLGKSEMRRKYWDPVMHESVGAPVRSITDLPGFFGEWLGYSVDAMHQRKRDPDDAANTLFDRASLIQMICLSVSEVPERKPFLMGESYIDIPALFIPRLLWPDKPSSLLANVRLAVYFNLVDSNNAFNVSIAFGPLAEAYVNFGFFGVGLLGLVFGAAFKRISMLSDGMPQFSALGIFMLLLTAWSFQVEQVMATWLSSLFQASVVCIGLPLLYRKLTVA